MLAMYKRSLETTKARSLYLLLPTALTSSMSREESQDLDLTDLDTLLAIGQQIGSWYSATYLSKEPRYTSSRTGIDLVAELLNGNHNRFFDHTRMSKKTFLKLVTILEAHGMKDMRVCNTPHQLLIFLYIVSNGASNRAAQEHFQHSGETISRCFYASLDALCSFAKTVIVQPTGMLVPREISSNPKFYPYFKDAVGAIDGTHIPAQVDAAHQVAFRDRNGNISQNCLAACSFDLQFQYVLAGWEGSAHYGLLLSNALATDFVVPPGKYFLADAGFALSESFLVPYRGVRYHLREWERGRKRHA